MKMLKTAVVLLSLVVAAFAAAQENTEPKVTVKIDQKTVKPGGVVKGEITVTFGDGLHGYQNPPSDEYSIPVSVELLGKDFKELKPKYPAGSDFMMDGKNQKVYMGTIKIPFTAKLPKKPGKYDLKITLNYQQCTASACFPPGKVETKTKVEIKKPVKSKKG